MIVHSQRFLMTICGDRPEQKDAINLYASNKLYNLFPATESRNNPLMCCDPYPLQPNLRFYSSFNVISKDLNISHVFDV
jgi:hypothetical protein